MLIGVGEADNNAPDRLFGKRREIQEIMEKTSKR
jgi:hypothetical protein